MEILITGVLPQEKPLIKTWAKKQTPLIIITEETLTNENLPFLDGKHGLILSDKNLSKEVLNKIQLLEIPYVTRHTLTSFPKESPMEKDQFEAILDESLLTIKDQSFL